MYQRQDYVRCRSERCSKDVMIGRGAVADPFLARRIRALAAGEAVAEDRSADWRRLQPLLASYWQQVCGKVSARQAPGRLKLWLGALRRNFGEADALFLAIRALRDVDEVTRVLQLHGVPTLPAVALSLIHISSSMYTVGNNINCFVLSRRRVGIVTRMPRSESRLAIQPPTKPLPPINNTFLSSITP